MKEIHQSYFFKYLSNHNQVQVYISPIKRLIIYDSLNPTPISYANLLFDSANPTDSTNRRPPHHAQHTRACFEKFDRTI